MNLADILDQHALTRPDHPAIQDGERIVSYAELKSKVVAAAANLNDAGIGFGDLVGVILNDSVEYIVVNYALAKLGAINIPINGRLPPSERERVVEGIGIKAVISNGKKTPLSMVPNLGVNQICRHTANALAQLPGSKSQLPFDENRTLMIVSSTGTTGSQKLIPMSHGQILSWNSAHQKYTGLMASDRYLSVVHFAFIAGSRRCIMMLHLGATVVINHATSVVNFFDQIAEKKINWTFLTPSHLKPLLDFATGDKPIIPTVKILVATSRLTPTERTLVRKRLTPNLIETYGVNEAGLVAVATPEDQVAHPESVGRLIEEIEAQIVDERDQPQPFGLVGNIRFRGSDIVKSYLNNPQATARAFRGGWFYPGDLAAINEAGFVFLKGRADDVINNEGAKFYPIELETVLLSHPDVMETAVLGWPHKRFGEVAVAFIVCSKNSVKDKELIAFCGAQIAPHKLPNRIIRLSELPRNAMGKVVKNRLRDQLNAKMDKRKPS